MSDYSFKALNMSVDVVFLWCILQNVQFNNLLQNHWYAVDMDLPVARAPEGLELLALPNN